MRRYRAIPPRRGASHVRPRPPSSGRPVQPVRAAAPDRRRIREYRGLDGRRRGVPLATRTVLTLAVVALAAGAFLPRTGGGTPARAGPSAGGSSAFCPLRAPRPPPPPLLP